MDRFPLCHGSTDNSSKSGKPEIGPNLSGGIGGHGGKGGRIGGDGGSGEAPQIPVEEMYRFRHVYGGTGGNGGNGGVQGGDGGIGHGQKFGTRLVCVREGDIVPTLPVADFCRQYCLSDKIHKLLGEQGFETAGALLEVSDISPLEDGFKKGQIAEMKRALKEFLFKHGLSVITV
ncbi:hypothetical protein FB451DRAFT_1285495, partial [Mycena latifolia]